MLDRFFEPLPFLHDPLAFLRLIPELRIADFDFKFAYLFLFRRGVKDSSGQRLPAAGAERTLFPVLLRSSTCSLLCGTDLQAAADPPIARSVSRSGELELGRSTPTQ
jgi:hypothetical protein